MRRAHSMPFGAETAAGGMRFRLWAPACTRVALEIGREEPRTVEMTRGDGGWHSARVEGLPAGTAYRFRFEDGTRVPDPASRSNPWDVDGPSAIVDPRTFDWTDDAWQGRPWHEAVVYELHVGTFTPEGTFAAAIGKLDHLAAAGVTAIEFMPVAQFPGRRGWGYDGVLPFAPDAAYGTPEDLKRLVVAAHARGLMVLLDVVYNHFGPEGNCISRYAPQFFNPARHTPWGAAINFDGEDSRTVRDFFVQNAVYWIEEFHLDGLRLDAVHAIRDESPTHIVAEIARAIAAGPGYRRRVHLVLENDRNEAHLIDRRGGRAGHAQWNDDWHHAVHVLLTHERHGYYVDYAERPAWHLARALAQGFSYQGETSAHRKGAARGERSAELPLDAFVNFLQNHDQVGNRALGERLMSLAPQEGLALATATLLLAPSIPMLFMGEEIGARTPFPYFCDFHGELARAVREGRRREFAAAASAGEEVADANAEATFRAAKIDWSSVDAACLARYKALLSLRAGHIVPRLAGGAHGTAFAAVGDGGVAVDWTLGDGSRLHLRANFCAAPLQAMARAPGTVLHREGGCGAGPDLPPWCGLWTLEAA